MPLNEHEKELAKQASFGSNISKQRQAAIDLADIEYGDTEQTDLSKPTIKRKAHDKDTPAFLKGKSSTAGRRATLANKLKFEMEQSPLIQAHKRVGEFIFGKPEVLPNELSKVSYIHDGDTLFLPDKRKVRLLGIDAPELGYDGAPDEPGAVEARESLRELFKDNTDIALVFGDGQLDKYGRMLAHALTADGRDVQKILLERGQVRALAIEPNTRLSEEYKKIENEAKRAQKGIWKQPIQTVPENYTPAYLRDDDYRDLEETAPTPILTDAKHWIIDDGVAANTRHWINDINEADRTDEDFKELHKKVPLLVEEMGLHPSSVHVLLEEAQNVTHAKILAERMLRIQRRAPGREAMGFAAGATSGILGFIGDPANLIPGALLLKSSAAVAKTLPTLSRIVTRAAPTLTGQAARWAAFGAVEEAIRTTPRLLSDPTYEIENYLLGVGTGAVFGAGIAKGMPAIKWTATNTIGRAWKGISGGIDSSFRKMRESLQLRTAANIISAAASGSAKVARNKNVRTTLKDMDTNSVVRAARDKAKEQVQEAKATNILARTAKALHAKLNKPDLDLADPKVLDDFRQSLIDTLGVTEDDTIVKRTVSDFKKAMEELDAPKQKQEGVDLPEPTPKQTFADTQRAVEKTRQAALDAIEKSTSKHKASATMAIEANTLQTVRALEAAAARQGVKVVRRVKERGKIEANIKNRLEKLIPDNTHKQFTSLLERLGVKEPSINMRAGFTRMVQRLNIPTEGKTARQALSDWILADPKKVTQRATMIRETITTEFNKLSDDLEFNYIGNPKDKDFLAAKKILRDQQDELESTFDWAGMVHTKQFADLDKLDPRWALLSQEFEDSIEPGVMKEIHQLYNSMAQKFISKQFGTLTESLAAKLIRTKVPLANHMAMTILELPAGTGGRIARNQTAAILAQMHESRITVPLEIAWRDMMEDAARDLGKGRIGRSLLQNKNPNTGGETQDIARQVMKEINARQMGKNINSPDYIREFADKLDTANRQLYDLQYQNGIEGITGANQMKHYLKQHWNDGAILDMLDNTNIGRSGTLELMSKSIASRSKGTLSKQAADDFAEVLLDLKIESMNRPQVDAFTLRSNNLNNSMASIEEIVERLEKNGKADSIKTILNWVKKDIGGSPSYVHKRTVDLDYETTITKNGQTVSILDLLDNDVIGNSVRYSKEAAGRSAISEATNGRLNSEQSINDYINAMGQQATDMGTWVNTKDVRNVFRQIMGLPYDGQLPMDWRKVRDAVSLAGMNGLGESQLAEFGLSVNRGLSGLFGLNQLASKTTGRLKQFAGYRMSESQRTNAKFLNELQEYSRLYEDMHIVARQNVHFDARESQTATSALQKVLDKGTGGNLRPVLQYMQTRYTGYGAVRTMEEQVAMASLIQDALKNIRTGKSFTSEARFKDIGLDLKLLKKKLDDGTIQLRNDGNIDALNMHRWSKADQQSVGVALQRHAGQQVQKSFAGEMSPLMTNPTVAFMMQFKSYPMLAAEKQMGRNMMFADKEAAMGITLNAASSAAARMVRYYSMALALPEEKRERYLEQKFSNDFAHDTAAYMGIVGMMVQNHDMAKDLVFGNESSFGDQLPVLNWADNALEATGIADPTGTIDERDVANIQRGAPLGTIMYVNMLAGIIRNMMETDLDENYQGDKALQRN